MCKTKNLQIKLESLDPTGVAIKKDAYHYGLNNSVVSDTIYVWIEKNNIQEREQDLLTSYGR